MSQTAIIVGAGMGGLAVSIRLARAGWKVTVLEKNTRVGGGLACHTDHGFLWDTGPVRLTMPFMLRDLFEYAGQDFEDYVELVPLDPVCRHFYPDGRVFNSWANFHLFQIEVARREGDKGEALEKFFRYTQGIHDLLAKTILFHPPADRLGGRQWHTLKNLPHFARVCSTRTMAETINRFFKNPHNRQFFMHYALEKGDSPHRLPALFSVLPHFETQGGAWYVRGGMYRLAEALERCARELGVEFLLDAEVQEIALKNEGVLHKPTAVGVSMRGGLRKEAAVVICNADPAHVNTRLMPGKNPAAVARRLDRKPFTAAPFTILWGVKRRYPQLAHHNVFFPADPAAEFHDIFVMRRPAAQPTIQLSISVRSDATQAPEGHDNYMVRVSAPALEPDHHWEQNRTDYRNRILERLEKMGLEGLSREILCEKVISPDEFAARTNTYRGALHGQAIHSLRNVLTAASHRSPRANRLYFVGRSADPCDMISAALLSARRVARAVATFQ